MKFMCIHKKALLKHGCHLRQCYHESSHFINIRIHGRNPVDTGRKLNVHKTFRRRPGRLLNVLCTFNLRPASTGKVSQKILFLTICRNSFRSRYSVSILSRKLVAKTLKKAQKPHFEIF